jgi:uncharacterized protein (TIGR03086 family)
MTLLDRHAAALEEFGRRVHAVRPDQWSDPTPDTDWDVRDLVGHLVVEQLWVPVLLDGREPAEIGDQFEGDHLGDNPVGAWDRACAGARDAFAAPGALDRPVRLSYGETPAVDYLEQMIADLVVHAWDLARGIGADDRLDPGLVAAVYERTAPHADRLAATGLFAPALPGPANPDDQTRLLALYGRRG